MKWDVTDVQHLFLAKGFGTQHFHSERWFFFQFSSCAWREVFPWVLILCYWPNRGLSCIHCTTISCCLAYVLEQHGLKDYCDCSEMCCVRPECVLNVNKVMALSISAKPSVWQGYRPWQVLAPVSALHWACLSLSLLLFAQCCSSGLLDGYRLHKSKAQEEEEEGFSLMLF